MPDREADSPTQTLEGKRTMKKLWTIAPALALLAMTACGNGEIVAKETETEDTSSSASDWAEDHGVTEADTAADAEPTEPETPEPEPEPALTAGQENAIGSAENYLSMTAFSRKGLIDQLKFEGYSSADATFAVDSLKPHWNAQAAKAAQNYLDMTSFSRSGLIEQLRFEGYSQSQAEYGVDQTGL